jgi:cell division protein FtsN
LILLVVGSFWVSFTFGKRLLSPSRPPEKIQVAIPEAPSSIAHLQKLAEAVRAKTVSVKPAAKKPAVKATKVTKTVAKHDRINWYKIQAGVFGQKSQASALSEKLNADGFETIIKSTRSGWRVQTGAFKNRTGALALQQSLKAKGYSSQIIVE